MVIKSLSWKSGTFGQLLNYIEKKAEKETPPIIHNLLGDSVGDFAKEFQDNFRFARQRKGGVVVYHEIISFHPDDREKLSPEIIEEFSKEWLCRRAPLALAYGHIHNHGNAPHLHLAISSNNIKSKNKLRLTRAEFRACQVELEEIQQQRYPDLIKSIAQKRRSPDRPRRTMPERQRNSRLKKEGQARESQKDMTRGIVGQCAEFANSGTEFEKLLSKQGLEIYRRGKNHGVKLETGRKFRFVTLGFAPKLDEEKERQKLERETAAARERQQKIDDLKTRLEQARQKSEELEQEELKKEKEFLYLKETDTKKQDNINEKDLPEQQHWQKFLKVQEKLKAAAKRSKELEIEWDSERER